MKTTNLKSKIMAGVLCATLVGGVGTALANPDAAGNLQSWYNTTSGKSLQSVWTAVSNYGNSKVKDLYKERDSIRDTAVGNVAKAGSNEITRANGAIGAAKQTYIDAIEARQALIESGMKKQYDDKVTAIDNTITGYANGAQKQAINDITSALNGQKDTSKGLVTTQVGQAKQDAIDALTLAISTAKSELEGLMATRETAATQSAKDNLDAQITAKREYITTETARLQGLKEKDITDEGSRIEGLAKSELDGLVNGIVNP